MSHRVGLYEKTVKGSKQDALDEYNEWCVQQIGIIRTINVHTTIAGFNSVHIEAYYEVT